MTPKKATSPPLSLKELTSASFLSAGFKRLTSAVIYTPPDF